MRAGEAVAETLEAAAKPATIDWTPAPVSSPADISANAVTASMRAKIAAMSAELAPAGPEIRAATAYAASTMTGVDEENAARLAAVGEQAHTTDADTARGRNGAIHAANWTTGPVPDAPPPGPRTR